MLASADAAHDPGRLAHDLRQEPERIARPSEVVPMASMIAEDVVARQEVLDDAYGVSLLSDARVRGPIQQSFLEQVEQALLEPANEPHASIEPVVPRLIRDPDQPGVRVGQTTGSTRNGAGGHRVATARRQ